MTTAHRITLEFNGVDGFRFPRTRMECVDPLTCPPVVDENGEPEDPRECWHKHMHDAIGTEQLDLDGSAVVTVLVDLGLPGNWECDPTPAAIAGVEAPDRLRLAEAALVALLDAEQLDDVTDPHALGVLRAWQDARDGGAK